MERTNAALELYQRVQTLFPELTVSRLAQEESRIIQFNKLLNSGGGS